MIFFLVLFFIIGCAVGSFLNVVIDRVSAGQSILGRSYCDHCRATLKTIDLIPIVSFVGLGGRCRYCRRPISWQYPLVEAVVGILFALSFYTLVANGIFQIVTLTYYFLILSILVVVAAVDVKFSLIPTSFVFAGALVSLFYNYFNLDSWRFVTAVLAALVVALVFLLIVAVTGGRGMGSGDAPLAFLVSLILGWPLALVAMFWAFAAGAIWAIFLLVSHQKKFGQAIPFGPFLATGAVVALFWGQNLLNWYLRLL